MLECTTTSKETFQQRKPKQLDTWLEKSLKSGIPALQTFAEGIKQDYKAVVVCLGVMGRLKGKSLNSNLAKDKCLDALILICSGGVYCSTKLHYPCYHWQTLG
jgi:hypothetical protein